MRRWFLEERGLPIAKALRLNERIRVSPIRLINENNDQLGVIPTHQALAMAREQGLDLVEVSPTESPPVCRIMDYGKSQYEKKKRQKAAAGSHHITLKEIRLRPKTDEHDRGIKLKHAKGFLEEGHKVQFTMLFRGRERFHREIAHEIFNEMITELGDYAKLERPPSMEGRRMTMIVSATKKAIQVGRQQALAAEKADKQDQSKSAAREEADKSEAETPA